MSSIAILASEQWDLLILKNIHASSDFFDVKSIHISLYTNWFDQLVYKFVWCR